MSGGSVGAVLLAAGRASRYGAPKQLVPIAGIPMVRRAVLTSMQCAGRTVVVTGAYRTEVEACLADLDVELAFNSAWQSGMGASIACGTARLVRMDANVRACLITLADQPLITAADLTALIEAHQQHPEYIIASRYGGNTYGAPCLFPRRHFEELMALEGPGGARSILRGHPGRIRAVSNPRAGVDIDTPDDLGKSISHCTAEGSPPDPHG